MARRPKRRVGFDVLEARTLLSTVQVVDAEPNDEDLGQRLPRASEVRITGQVSASDAVDVYSFDAEEGWDVQFQGEQTGPVSLIVADAGGRTRFEGRVEEINKLPGFTLREGGKAFIILVYDTIRTDAPESAGYALRVRFDEPRPDVELRINKTLADDDDITLLTPGRDARGPGRLGFGQSVLMDVTNVTDAEKAIRLEVPGGQVRLDQPRLRLGPGETRTVLVQPNRVSAEVNDVLIVAMEGDVEVGREDMTVVSVVLPERIRAANTPAGMRDRIPPRVATSFEVRVTPDLGDSGQIVTLAVINQGAGNGLVAVNGGPAANLTATGTVSLGTTGDVLGISSPSQTRPGSAGRLQLVARVRGLDTVRTPGFSVAAIPQNYSTRFLDTFNGWVVLPPSPCRSRFPGLMRSVGILVENSWESDSGELADLDQVERREFVRTVGASGVLRTGEALTQPCFGPAVGGSTQDFHGIPLGPLDLARGPRVGQRVTRQTFIFNDRRTGARGVFVPNSGFEIVKEVFEGGDGVMARVTKRGRSFFPFTGPASGDVSPPAQKANLIL